MKSKLQAQLKKRHAFDSIEQEATLAILRTSDILQNRLARLLREYGLTMSQYNVLRILRGEGRPLPCLEIANRMIQVAPAITRVIDQLLAMQLITKTQSATDRRVFEVESTDAAGRILKELDQPILDLHAELMSTVSKATLKELIRILDQVREGLGS